jgi:heptosyltransferase-1
MKILIIKTSSLGDIIHTFPVVAYLRSKLPKAQIDWVVEAPFAELVQSHPSINRVICIKSKAWRRAPFKVENRIEIRQCRKLLREQEYDVVFDLQGNIKSSLILAQTKSAHKVGFGFKSAPEWPNCLFTNCRFNPPSGNNIRDDYLALVQSYFKEVKASPIAENITLKISPEQNAKIDAILNNLPKTRLVMVCPGSAWPNKQMAAESLTDFLTHLQAEWNCHFLILWGSPQEKVFAESLCNSLSGHASILDKMPLQMLQNMMNRLDLIISMDSLPLHLAGTTKTPSFSVFGPSSAKKYAPEGHQHQSFQGTCPYGRTFEKRCPILRTCSTGSCIRNLNGQQVFEEWKNKDTKTITG